MFICIYRPPSQNKQYFLEKVLEIIDHFSSIYDNYIILGDFNMEPSDSILKSFMQSHNLFNLIKSNTFPRKRFLHRSDSYKPKILF